VRRRIFYSLMSSSVDVIKPADGLLLTTHVAYYYSIHMQAHVLCL
jgi:hypothetical protein